MSRSLQNKTVLDLELMAEGNRLKKAKLELIRSELMSRSTNAAANLRARSDAWIDNSSEGAEKSREASLVPHHPQAHQWTYDAVAKLPAKLIDLSRKSPLISFKHTSRSSSQLRFVDERPDLLVDQLCSGSMGFEPLPGEEQTPADQRTPTFGIAYERARLTDAEFLGATEKLGDAEVDVRAWQDAERGLRARDDVFRCFDWYAGMRKVALRADGAMS